MENCNVSLNLPTQKQLHFWSSFLSLSFVPFANWCFHELCPFEPFSIKRFKVRNENVQTEKLLKREHMSSWWKMRASRLPSSCVSAPHHWTLSVDPLMWCEDKWIVMIFVSHEIQRDKEHRCLPQIVLEVVFFSHFKQNKKMKSKPTFRGKNSCEKRKIGYNLVDIHVRFVFMEFRGELNPQKFSLLEISKVCRLNLEFFSTNKAGWRL